MAKAAASSSALEDLDLSGEEVQRITSAFKDPEFRRMFSEYAAEITDPENRRRYEEEIAALERERGVEVRFVHPEPGHVLRTSLDGEHRCFVNVCSNSLVGVPSSRPGPGPDGTAAGSHWSLPYSLAPGRPYAGRSARYTVYDVVFHPDALALARRHERFREMLDATALEAVEQQFGVKLDRRNAKTLKIKYKGTPEAAVLRTPLPGGVPTGPEGEPPGPLPIPPYPYRYPAAAASTARAPAPPAPEAEERLEPTEPRWTVVQRHHVDLQDYRCSRDAVPSPVPDELVVTIELPLLRSAERAELEVKGKLLCLDSRSPDYRLRLSLPYPVDDGRGKAQFNKARRQLVVTLPVALRAARQNLAATSPEESLAETGTDPAARASADDLAASPEVPAAETGTDPEACTSSDDLAASPEESAAETGTDPADDLAAMPPEVSAAETGTVPAACASAGDLAAMPPEVSAAETGTVPAACASVDDLAALPPEVSEAETGTDPAACASAGDLAAAWEKPAAGTGADGGEESGVGAPGLGAADSAGELVPEPELDIGGDAMAPLGEGPPLGSLPCRDASGPTVASTGTESMEPSRPPLQCNQDDDSLTLLVRVPRIQPQSLRGDLSPLGYTLRFSAQGSGYSFTVQFAPGNKLSTKEPEISVSLSNAVIVLAKSPESRGHWREWYCGVSSDSLEERLFVTEENVDEFLEEALRSPVRQARSPTPPLIEVLQVTDEKVQIHAKLQVHSNRDGPQGKEKGANEACPLTEKENTEHFTTSTTDSDSLVAVKPLKINTCGSVVDLQHSCPDVPHTLSGTPQYPEAKMDPEFIKENSATCSTSEKENIKEPVIAKEKELHGDHVSPLWNRTVVQNVPDSESIKETNMQDGSVQIINDHTTHCAFSFQNSLLYDLD